MNVAFLYVYIQRLFMILSGQTIKKLIQEKKLVIDPIFDDTIRENGVDLKIGTEIARFKKDKYYVTLQDIQKVYQLDKKMAFIVNAYEHMLLTTKEYIELPSNVVGFVNLRSTFARMGLFIPPTIIDAGFKGQLTIEIVGSAFPILLDAGQRFLHVVFAYTDEPVENPYHGKYQNQFGVTGAKADEV